MLTIKITGLEITVTNIDGSVNTEQLINKYFNKYAEFFSQVIQKEKESDSGPDRVISHDPGVAPNANNIAPDANKIAPGAIHREEPAPMHKKKDVKTQHSTLKKDEKHLPSEAKITLYSQNRLFFNKTAAYLLRISQDDLFLFEEYNNAIFMKIVAKGGIRAVFNKKSNNWVVSNVEFYNLLSKKFPGHKHILIGEFNEGRYKLYC